MQRGSAHVLNAERGLVSYRRETEVGQQFPTPGRLAGPIETRIRFNQTVAWIRRAGAVDVYRTLISL